MHKRAGEKTWNSRNENQRSGKKISHAFIVSLLIKLQPLLINAATFAN